MSYRGSVYQISCVGGSLTGNPNIDSIPANMMLKAKNINLHENGRGKRGGTAHDNTSVITNTPEIMGLCDYILLNKNQFLVFGTRDGDIYKNYTTTLKTGLTADNYFNFEVMDDTLFVSNGSNRPQTWDGVATTTSDITSIPSDWTGVNFPKQLIKHGRGNSQRLWALAMGTNPSKIYASENNDGNDFSDGNVLTFDIETGDGYGIVGGVEFGDRLFLFGKNRTYILDDTDSSTANWGYKTAQWFGGASHWRLIVKTPNDIISMTDNGDIYSVSTAEQYGDYKIASITKPTFMDKWIRDNVALEHISKFHAVYDPELRIVRFFIVRKYNTEIDTCLVYYIDKGEWVIHDNLDYVSGYSAASSTVVKDLTNGSTKIYTGGYSGFVWKLEQLNQNDNGNDYYSGFKTAFMTFDNPRIKKFYDLCRIITIEQGNISLFAKVWIDGIFQSTYTLTLLADGAIYGTDVYGTGVWAGEDILIENDFRIGNKGKRVELEIYNSNADEDFFISQILLDYRSLGGQRE
jgi:hypothetical protein